MAAATASGSRNRSGNGLRMRVAAGDAAAAAVSVLVDDRRAAVGLLHRGARLGWGTLILVGLIRSRWAFGSHAVRGRADLLLVLVRRRWAEQLVLCRGLARPRRLRARALASLGLAVHQQSP